MNGNMRHKNVNKKEFAINIYIYAKSQNTEIHSMPTINYQFIVIL